MSSHAYREGDPEAVTARYRIHFRHALCRREYLDRLMERMSASFVHQGPAGIRMARAVEERLLAETWHANGYDLHPSIADLCVPALVITGDHDFTPGPIQRRIADVIPGARTVMIEACGHFAFLEQFERVREELISFLTPSRA